MRLFQIIVAETNISRQQVSVLHFNLLSHFSYNIMHRILSYLLLLVAVVSAAPGPSVYNPDM